MSRGNISARDIIKRAVHREQSQDKVARFYGISRVLVDCYLRGQEDCGTVTARKVIRVEIARLNAVREGRDNFFPEDKDRYKGTREIR